MVMIHGNISQFSQFRVPFRCNELNADHEEVENDFPCRPEYWKTTNFMGNIILIIDKKHCNSFKLATFCLNPFCYMFYVSILRLVTYYVPVNSKYGGNYLFKIFVWIIFFSFFFLFIEKISWKELSLLIWTKVVDVLDLLPEVSILPGLQAMNLVKVEI